MEPTELRNKKHFVEINEMVEDVMSDWKSVKESKPKKDQVVVFLQLSTGKYFAGYLESEIVHGENSYFWVTATGHCKDMKEDDFWLSFPCYEGFDSSHD